MIRKGSKKHGDYVVIVHRYLYDDVYIYTDFPCTEVSNWLYKRTVREIVIKKNEV